MSDTDEFGLMESSDDISALKARVLELEHREQELLSQQTQIEEDFGQKRAKFRELFLQKEAELKSVHDGQQQSQQESEGLAEQLEQVTLELNDIKTAVAVSEANKEEEILKIKKLCEQEVDSMQSLLREAAEEASSSTAMQYEVERTKLQELNETYEEEIQSFRNKKSQDRKPGFISSVLDVVSGAGLNTTIDDENESLEESMRKAQKDAQMLRSVVLPLEEEIEALKKKLEDHKQTIRQLSKQNTKRSAVGYEEDIPSPTDLPSSSKSVSLPSLDDISDRDDKLTQLTENLKTEKSHRRDMEMYAGVLELQKNTFQDEAEKLQNRLQEVYKDLEEEKRAHQQLQQTWELSTDEFLESQRLTMTDMRRIEKVLSTEQQRVIAVEKEQDKKQELKERFLNEKKEREKQKDALNKTKGSNHAVKTKNSEKMTLKEPSPMDKLTKGLKSVSNTSLNSMNSNDSRLFEDSQSFSGDVNGKHGSDLDISQISLNNVSVDSVPVPTSPTSGSPMTTLRISPDKTIRIHSLTADQINAIKASTPERELLTTMTTTPQDALSMEGRRLVSDKEWHLIQEEVKAAREKLGRPCDMCNNYEAQLQNVQEEMKEHQTKGRLLGRDVQMQKQMAESQKQYIEKLETSLKEEADNASKEICSLVSKEQECSKYITELTQQFNQAQMELQDHMKSLTSDREKVQKELLRLQEDNDSLIGKHSKHAEQLQNEDINLPNNLEEMQLLLLKYREEIISAKVAQEHTSEKLRSQLLFLKDRVQGEQQEKNKMEETLSQEISSLQEKMVVQESLKSELERESYVRSEAEVKLREAEQGLKSQQAKSKQLIHGLQIQLEEQSTARTQYEHDVQKLERKVQSLQGDLANSEAVQADFVKLSQSLQIQLESFRQTDVEVRWENEDDVEVCHNCKQNFSVTFRKHHCRHCGKVFCSSCTSKTVHSGPKMRPAKVCDVCHTILNKDAMPYFSTEAPSVPD